jgi:N-acetylmuramoyl-L-alanine amidase
LSNKIIAIDAGHGGTDPGAVGFGLQEKELTLKIARFIESHIHQKYNGAEVKLTRTEDKTVSLASRTGMANSWKSDCLVSVHINSAASTQANGFESFVFTSDGPASKSVALQTAIHGRVSDIFTAAGRADRGTKKANFHMVREFRGAAVLVEIGFIINREDSELLKSNDFLKKVAAAIGDGVADYLKLEQKAPADKPKSYRVTSDDKQLGAFSSPSNITKAVSGALEQSANKITIEKL